MREPLRFGLISDIQYADIEPASNFGGSEHREYRASAKAARSALVEIFSSPAQPSFIAQLGDLIDGQNAGAYGQGLALVEPQSESALEHTLSIWDEFSTDVYHTIGNHELYNFTWEELKHRLNRMQGSCHHHLLGDKAYGSFSPQEGWRVIILNSYEVNVIEPRDDIIKAKAEELLSRMNPNYGQPAPFNFFQGLSPEKMRYVPFNGGFGQDQLNWLSDELKRAGSLGERCLLFSHLPVCVPAASERNIAFDANEFLEIIARRADHISAYFAGHRHSGGSAIDDHGIPHVTIQSPLTHGMCAAVVDVDDHSLQIKGIGAHRSYHFDR